MTHFHTQEFGNATMQCTEECDIRIFAKYAVIA